MKNVIFIIADSMSYDRIHSKSGVGQLTPFLDKINNQSITAKNLYSQGPYTEAGTKGLLCSCDTLDNGGYYLRYDTEKKFITDYFKDLGFVTYNINSPWYLLSKRTLDNIDHNYYTSGFDFRFIWSQRFSFYKKRWMEKKLTDSDYKYLIDFVNLVFETADDYFCDSKREEKYTLIKEYIDIKTLNENIDVLKKEREKFNCDCKSYIDSIFEQEMRHPIFGIKNIKLDKMIRTKSVNHILHKNRKFVSKFKKIQFLSNLKNNHCSKGIVSKTIIRCLKDKKVNKNNSGELFNRLRNLISNRELKVYRTGYYYSNDPYKLIPSAKTLCEYAASLVNENSDENRFIFIHPEEPHYFNTFFTYDSDNENLLQEEFDYAAEYLAETQKGYKGSLYYDLSVRYIDRQVRLLYENLCKSGNIENTLIVLTADHGSSYFFDPIRSTLVNNMHSENYHVPLYIFGGNTVGCTIERMSTSKDIIPTIAELLGNNVLPDAKGNSMLNDDKNDSVIIEYMGPGCPDIRLKPIWLSARSMRYSVCFIGALYDDFNESNITEIYDLINDPYELTNICDFRNTEIETLINKLKVRFTELKEKQKGLITVI